MLYAVNSTGTKKPITEFMPLLTDAIPQPPELPNEEERKALREMAKNRLQFIPANN